MFNKNAFVFLKPVLTDFITLLTWYEDMMNKILWYYMVQGRNVSLVFFFKEEKGHFSQQLKMINWSSVCPGDEIYKK